ncbi:hypothetical protein K443DRAFT_116594 [Laccaria amethystina LaAM-08-1]|uniref:Uncharacterized protein n=1 Tax=Laccaria amethystina LaAM-08-1 TaxID=1095629 RepID=A0A0C9WRF6_9AGAR|nr:hypothetical protein K443DRAFT_116594 [Laccaria amethystina LaAM-08-1]
MPTCQLTLCAGVGQPDCSRSKWSIGTDHGTIEHAPNARSLAQKAASRKIAAVGLCPASANLPDLWAPLAPTVDIFAEYCIGTHSPDTKLFTFFI